MQDKASVALDYFEHVAIPVAHVVSQRLVIAFKKLGVTQVVACRLIAHA